MTPMDETTEINRTVPQHAPPPHDGRAPIDRLMGYLEGWFDETGKRHKGLLERMTDLEIMIERKVSERAALDAERAKKDAQAERDRLDWRKGIGLATAGASIATCFTWLREHIH